jgi:hypothetical protein
MEIEDLHHENQLESEFVSKAIFDRDVTRLESGTINLASSYFRFADCNHQSPFLLWFEARMK